MSIRKGMGFVVFATVAALAAPVAPAAAAGSPESFETGFGGWRPDTDGLAPVADVTRSTKQAYDGIFGLRVFMDGRQDDGTTWVERKLAVKPNAKVRVTLTFWLWSERESFVNKWAVVAAAGVRDPERESDFTIVGQTEDVAGWKQYELAETFTADSTGTIWVAMGTSVLWETEREHFLDYVTVDIESPLIR